MILGKNTVEGTSNSNQNMALLGPLHITQSGLLSRPFEHKASTHLNTHSVRSL